MTKISESAMWETDIYQVNRNDKVSGGKDGVANIQARQLANRTLFLKDMVESAADYREFTFYKKDTDPDGTISGLAATTDGQLFRVITRSDENPAHVFNYYKNTLGVAVLVNSSPSKGYVDGAYKSTGLFATALTLPETVLYQRPKTSHYTTATSTGWAVGVVSNGNPVNYVEFWLNNLTSVKTLKLDVYERTVDGKSVFPGAASDIPIQNKIYDVADVASKDVMVSGYQLVRFKIKDVVIANGATILFSLQAFDSTNQPVYTGSGRQDVSSPAVNSLDGMFKNLSTTWQLMQGNFRIAYKCGFNNPVQPDAGVVENRKDVAAKLPNSVNFSIGSADNARWYAWAVGFTGVTQAFDLITLYHSNLTAISSVFYRIVIRANTDLSLNSAPGNAQADREVYSGKISLSLKSSSTEFLPVEYPVPGLFVPEGYFAILEVHAYDKDGNYTDIGTQVRDYAAAGETLPTVNGKGYFVNRARNTWSAMGDVFGLAWKLSLAGYIPTKEKLQQVAAVSADNAAKISAMTSTTSTHCFARYFPTLTVSGRQVAIGGSAVVNGVTKALAGTLMLATTTVGTKTVATVLKQASSSTVQWPANGNEWLGEKRISAVTVTDTATSAPLTAGTHYNVDGYGGKLRGLTATQYNVSAAFTYTRERYDLIQIDPHTLAMSVVQGTERAFDVQEYRPLPAAGRVALYYVLVAGDVLEFEPVYRYPEGGYEMLDNGDAAVMRQHNRRCLQKTLARMARGQAITLLGYGDSITAVSNITNPLTTPGGTSRDRQLFLQGGYGTDTLSNLYPSENWNDGGGAIHIKIGWNWKLKAHLEDAWGCAVTYVNFGVSGSNSASGATAERLNAAVAATPNLAVVCFGMNDNAVATTYASMMTIINTLKASGADVVVMPVPRTSLTEDGRYSLEQWRYTNRQVYRAAIDAGAAYVPTDWLSDEMSRGGMGVVTTSLCGADLRNHPGGYEMAVYGRSLVNVFC